MEDYTIGIKTGDGQFYPVLEESFTHKKRLVLTTVHDNQTSVQIDFYRSLENKIEDSEYIGSLVIENIEESPKKTPEIEVIINIDEEKNLHAVAKNLASDDKQSLTVSLESLGAGQTYDIPEFEIDEKLTPSTLFESDSDLGDENDDSLDKRSNTPTPDAGMYPYAVSGEKDELEEKKSNPLLLVLFVLGGIFLIAAILFGIFALTHNQKTGKTEPINISDYNTLTKKTEAAAMPSKKAAKPTKTVIAKAGKKTEEPVATATTTATVTATITATATTKPVEASSNKVEQKNGKGYWYTVKRNDTLWDISIKAYGSPWRFYVIYGANIERIPYPGYLLIGTQIFIPEN